MDAVTVGGLNWAQTGVVSLFHAADFPTMEFLLHSSHYVDSSTKVI